MLPKRWQTILFLVGGVFISYLIRVSMSVAVVKIADELDWSESQKGLMLSAFFWGYAAGQLPARYLASTYGAKWMFGLSILMPSVLSLITPMVILSPNGLVLALAVRALLGLGASGTFPSAYHFYPEWIPLEEKTIMITTVGSGMYLGEIVGFSLSGYLCEHRIMWIPGMNIGSWPSVFILFGVLGVLWFPFFIFCVHSSPDEDPNISQEELYLIHKGKEGFESLLHPDSLEDNDCNAGSPPADAYCGAPSKERARSVSMDIVYDPHANEKMRKKRAHPSYQAPRVPWTAFFTHPASLTLLLNNWCFGWIGFMLLSEIPAYLTDVLGFELESAGALAIAPYVANFVSSVGFGIMFDRLQRDYNWETRRVRQWAQFIGLGGSSGMLVACSFVSSPYGAYSLMVLALFFFGAISSGLGCAFLDVSPRFSSSLNTIGNTIGALAGLSSPIIVAALVSAFEGVWGWRFVFILTMLMSGVGLLSWYFHQTSNVVSVLNTPVGADYRPVLTK